MRVIKQDGSPIITGTEREPARTNWSLVELSAMAGPDERLKYSYNYVNERVEGIVSGIDSIVPTSVTFLQRHEKKLI